MVAGKLDTFGDDDGEESDGDLCGREWRDSELGEFGDLSCGRDGGRLRRLLPNTASGQGRMGFLAAFVSTAGTWDDVTSSTN